MNKKVTEANAGKLRGRPRKSLSRARAAASLAQADPIAVDTIVRAARGEKVSPQEFEASKYIYDQNHGKAGQGLRAEITGGLIVRVVWDTTGAGRVPAVDLADPEWDPPGARD